MEVRKAELKDLKVLVEFNINLALETEQKELQPDVVEKGVRTLLENPTKGNYYLVEIEGQIAGSLMVNIQWIDWKASSITYIESVYTRPEFRGQGVFKTLYKTALNEAKIQSFALRLYAEEFNHRALEVYSRLGMTIIDSPFLEMDFAFPEIAGSH